MLKLKIFSLLIVAISLIFLVFTANFALTYQYSGHDKCIIVKNNSSIINIAGIFKREGIFPYEKLLTAILVFVNQFHTLKAGEYRINNQMELYLIIRDIINGKTYQRILSIIPGLSNYEVQSLFLKSFKDCNYAFDDESVYFFPDNYYFTYEMSCNSIANLVVENSKKLLDRLWSENKNPALKNKDDLLKLASIIEKESSKDDEMGKISAVFSNRMRNGMKLQADPTTIYAITKGRKKLNRALTSEDLLIKDSYNTYNTTGLPPTKICNPGLKSLKAAANPEKVDHLYFVADGNGGHLFASTLEKHIKNVKKH